MTPRQPPPFNVALRDALVKAVPGVCRKLRHETWESAERQVAELRGRADCVEPESLWAYRCWNCGGIHVGHDRRYGGALPEVE
jgi:hypothetical protein